MAAVVGDSAVAHFHDAGGDPLREVPVVAGEDDRPLIFRQGVGEGVHGIDVEMVARLVQDQHVVVAQQQSRQTEPGALAAGQHGDGLLDVRPTEQQGAGYREDLLDLLPEGGLGVKIIEDRLVLREAGVDVLGVGADLAAVRPADFPGEGLE